MVASIKQSDSIMKGQNPITSEENVPYEDWLQEANAPCVVPSQKASTSGGRRRILP